MDIWLGGLDSIEEQIRNPAKNGKKLRLVLSIVRFVETGNPKTLEHRKHQKSADVWWLSQPTLRRGLLSTSVKGAAIRRAW
jgi:hypothetical protein